MTLSRRTELLVGCGAFAALGAALWWQASAYWRTGAVQLLPFTQPVATAWALVAAIGLALLGTGTILASALFLRARWTPPPPGDPVELSPDRT